MKIAIFLALLVVAHAGTFFVTFYDNGSQGGTCTTPNPATAIQIGANGCTSSLPTRSFVRVGFFATGVPAPRGPTNPPAGSAVPSRTNVRRARPARRTPRAPFVLFLRDFCRALLTACACVLTRHGCVCDAVCTHPHTTASPRARLAVPRRSGFFRPLTLHSPGVSQNTTSLKFDFISATAYNVTAYGKIDSCSSAWTRRFSCLLPRRLRW